ncbi:MAG: hypothetical protein K2X47_18920, partial [Bdellovibrionales bacterium]|nr:hypothetical protein [Bdellovibrionales bacterium]
MILLSKNLLLLPLLTVSFSLNAVGGEDPIPRATNCPAIAAGTITMPELSGEMVATLRGILADVFLNSDKIFKQYRQANPRLPERISAMGSSVSVNSYGIYRVQLPGQSAQ